MCDDGDVPPSSSGSQELDDAELLASLEAQEEVEPGPDSGYWTLSNTSTQSARSSSTRSFVSTVSSRFVP